MNIRTLHPWTTSETNAVEIQHVLEEDIEVSPIESNVSTIAGIDTAFDHINNTLFAAACLFSYPDLEIIEKVTDYETARFPYIAGLHAFREGPVILKTLSHLKNRPDVIMFAAHGIAHPRRCGMASHLGIILDLPAIGCSRKLLIGEHGDIGPREGENTPLFVHNREVGAVYRSRYDVKPIYISPGHKCTLSDAIRYTVSCLKGYRIPEPLRAAHRLANRIKRNAGKLERV